MFPDSYFQNRLEDRREKVLVMRHLVRRENILRPAEKLLTKVGFFGQDPVLGFL